MGFKEVQTRYRIPFRIRRGMTVNYGKENMVITSTPRYRPGSYINVRDAAGRVWTHHPFALDYHVDGQVIRGDDLKAAYDAAWDKWNGLA